jgi:iron only hydrogenase large subunit-like protein
MEANMKILSPVVTVDKEKCVNCHACIAACPVKFCNNGSLDYVDVNESICIGCGSCIKACTHNARIGIDDSFSFFDDIHSGNFIAIAAPAVAANFPYNYLKLNGWLNSLGVKAFFDVSFGAELTVKSYLEHINKNSPKAVIAQPCPAIVTYIEIYRPELLEYLAPADSPMAHTIKMIKEYYPEYSNSKILVLSPCVAKRREFDELGLGKSIYNVTYKSIDSYLKNNNIKLENYEEIEYSNKSAERAVLFSTPGGLLRTVEREIPSAAKITRKIEGNKIIYHYLDKLKEMITSGKNPLLIDCLNCELGCNGGPGTLNIDKSPDEIEFLIEERNEQMQNRYKRKNIFGKKQPEKKLKKIIDSYWKEGLYDRSYIDLSDNNTIRKPDSKELKNIYEKMAKYSDADIYNCNTCGYGECEKMATAIFNGLNKPENCHHYNLELIKIENNKTVEDEAKLLNIVQENITITKAIENIVKQMIDNNNIIITKTGNLTDITDIEKERYKDILLKLNEIAVSINNLDSIVATIIDISRKSNILALNATIEASRAGQHGKAFAVVANEVKKMSNQSQEEAKKIQPFAEELKGMMSLFVEKINCSFDSFNNQTKLIKDVSIVASEITHIANELEEKSKILAKF